MGDAIRIANCSGFYGDRLSAAREMVEIGPIDVLTGDYLAELTMAILWRNRTKDSTRGYATSFLRQMEDVMGTCLDGGIRIVSNAGGLNPRGLAEALEDLADRLGLAPQVAVVEGDDIVTRLDDYLASGNPLAHLDTGEGLIEKAVTPVTANAYLGLWPIAEGLARGADIVITGRVTDAAVVMGPAAWHHGWGRTDWDALAGALVAGHIIECGTQCCGGNYSFFDEVPGLDRIGFPIAEIRSDGSALITKHPGTGGQVSVGTVTAQLLYEIGDRHYLNPDVTARFDTIQVADAGPDQVLVSGTLGEPPPATTKVALNYLGGYRNTVGMLVPGLNTAEKAAAAEAALWTAAGGKHQYAEVDVELLGGEHADPRSNVEAITELRVTVKDPDPVKVGRAFSSAAVELALATYPGFSMTGPPGEATPYAVYWPTTVAASSLQPTVALNGEQVLVPMTVAEHFTIAEPLFEATEPPAGSATHRALGAAFGARSGDKGGNANVGVWARSAAGFAWLERFLTVEQFRSLIPESVDLPVERYDFPNLWALNFVVVGLLGEGVASSTRVDPQAKSLGEYLRAKHVDIPDALVR